jgi:phospholipid/cholesterol/gamma-HCH transport system substrate-binding protein
VGLGSPTGRIDDERAVQALVYEQITITPGRRARLQLKLSPNLALTDDTIASIRTKGIIGDKFVKISIGNSEKTIPPGGKIHDTESAVEWEELISKFIHGKV